MNDIINKLQLEIGCSSEEQAFDVRHNIVHTQQAKIIEAINECCQKYSGYGDWLIIDKLEIDLGNFGQLSFENEFKSAFKKKFEEALIQEIAQSPMNLGSETSVNNRFQLITKFLKEGSLPWWAYDTNLDIDDVLQEIIDASPELLRNYLQINLNNESIWERISFQLNTNIQVQITRLFDELNFAVKKFTSWIRKKNEEHSKIDKLKSKKYTGKVSQRKHVISQIETTVVHFILRNTPLIIHTKGGVESLRKVFDKFFDQIFVNSPSSKPSPSIQELLVEKTTEIDTSESRIEEMINKVSESKEDVEKLAVRLAGIALIVPFLKALFLNLKWYQNNQWANKMAQYKAVHMLHYIGTGELNKAEFELTLEKIICGLVNEESLPLEVSLTELEMSEALELLKSVIEHWPALKNTSIESLRDTFFRRDGLLRKVDNGWTLQVERKTVDVLIDSIPWGIGQIILPWNDYIIIVEW